MIIKLAGDKMMFCFNKKLGINEIKYMYCTKTEKCLGRREVTQHDLAMYVASRETGVLCVMQQYCLLGTFLLVVPDVLLVLIHPSTNHDGDHFASNTIIKTQYRPCENWMFVLYLV